METDEKIAVACGVLIVLIIILAAVFIGPVGGNPFEARSPR
jgi:hypothetical protein